MNWLKQTTNNPLFPDLLWSRPENKRQAGKLLVIGGNQHGFAAPVSAYNSALKAGVGVARVILPDILKRAVGTAFTEAIYAPSTPSGSLAKTALGTIIDEAGWADGILLAGDFGRNSETAILLASFLEKYKGQITLAQDAVDYFLSTNSPLLARHETLTVINMGKLQKLVKNNRPQLSIHHSMSLYEVVQTLQELNTTIITKHADSYIVTADQKVSTTAIKKDQNWQIEVAPYAGVWWLQNQKSCFNSLTTAVFEFVNS
ncbi:MAG TPA: hypothetical protein VFB03_00240 [Candidatus Saccharimonadales bacterium]|nr:hypothetical protein [Candidatus Saccharimonadales bacterium]